MTAQEHPKKSLCLICNKEHDARLDRVCPNCGAFHAINITKKDIDIQRSILKRINMCPHTPAAPEISNIEFAKGLAECLGNEPEEHEECNICPLLGKCIDLHLMDDAATIRNQTLDEVLPGIQEDINDLTKEVCVGFHTMQGVQDELQKISYKIESLRSTQSTGTKGAEHP